MQTKIQLSCGSLCLDIRRAELPLDELLGFATRSNPKRGFLFVSKVLGKHWPCKPTKMRLIYDLLAQKIQSSTVQTLVLGMAETATGLGAGVADSLVRLGDDKVISQQTTRHELPLETLITFDEVHSHAPDQLLYPPLPHLAPSYFKTERMVLVDDEMTSGRTLKELAVALLKRFEQTPQSSVNVIGEMVFVSIVSWLSEAQKLHLQALIPVPLRFESLLEGEFEFERNLDFKPSLPGQVSAKTKANAPRDDLGRRGLRLTMNEHSFDLTHLQLDPRRPVSVIGTGEFTFHPFLLAEKLSAQGFDVLYQSTTRSPILLGGAIQQSLTISDEHGEGVTNYLHNPPSSDRQVIVAYESSICEQTHHLSSLISPIAWIHP
jgi:hypothetical protein